MGLEFRRVLFRSKPFLVKSISKEGKEIESFETETINSSICSRRTLEQIKDMLEGVVEHGTAKVIKSDKISLAGKTGTAQLSQGALGYTSGGKKHQVSFCGYFPADKPAYSCIVVVRAPRNGYPSGGGMSGMVFKNIAERVYAQGRSVAIEANKDTSVLIAPKVKNGNFEDLATVLGRLNLRFENEEDDDAEWVKTEIKNKKIHVSAWSNEANLIPSVIGMGAKDAVFLLENSGLKVQISGKGKVYNQSKPAGRRITRGETVVLNLR